MQLTPTAYEPKLLEKWRMEMVSENKIEELLVEYTILFGDVIKIRNQRVHFENYLRGLMSELPRKSVEPIALSFVGENGVRSMQQFMKRSPLDDEAILNEYQNQLAARISSENGMLSVDGSDSVKKGAHSVGAGRQYCGTVGKVESCQAGVFTAYAGDNGYGLVDRALYFQKKWFDDEYKDLRKKCNVPKETEFQTKNEIALTQIKNIVSKNLFHIKWFGCDAAFGCDHEFLDSLPENIPYFAAVKSSERIFLNDELVVVKSIADNSEVPWRRAKVGNGSKGAIYSDTKILRATAGRTIDNQAVRHDNIWLYIRKYENGDIKFFISNAPEETTEQELHEAATLRWPIEQCFQECKSYLGMEHCEGRSYTGLMRHWLFVMIAHLFTTSLRIGLKKPAFL